MQGEACVKKNTAAAEAAAVWCDDLRLMDQKSIWNRIIRMSADSSARAV